MKITEAVTGTLPDWLYMDPQKRLQAEQAKEAQRDSFGYPIPRAEEAPPVIDENNAEDLPSRRSSLGKTIGSVLHILAPHPPTVSEATPAPKSDTDGKK